MKSKIRNKKQVIKKQTGLDNLYLVSWKFNQMGVAPLIFLAISGIFLAVVLLAIASQSFIPKIITSTPAPSGTTIGGVVIASPIPVDPNDPALCDDEYNADCDNLEGDDVDPADLAGPD